MQRQNESKPLLKDQYPNYSEPISSTKNEKEKKKEKGKEKDNENEKDLVEAKASLDQLPPELIDELLKFLSFEELLQVMLVNKKINQITKNMRADDVYALRNMMIRAKKKPESKEIDHEFDIENPDEEKPIFFKNKNGTKSSIAELLSRMKECKEKSQQIPTLLDSAESTEKTVENCYKVNNRKNLVASSFLSGGISGAGLGIGFNHLVLQNSYPITSALVGAASGVVLTSIIPVSLICCSLYGMTLFANRNKQKADDFNHEMNNDNIHLLLTELSSSNSKNMN